MIFSRLIFQKSLERTYGKIEIGSSYLETKLLYMRHNQAPDKLWDKLHKETHTKPNQAIENHTKPNQAIENHIKLNQTKVNHTKPNQAIENHTKLNQTKVIHTKQ